MSPIGLALDLLLIALLLAALAFGVRLERRLRQLRESQAGFLQAVQELDGAAARAEHGLETLRRATEAAQVELTERLDEARGLIRRLERVTAAGAAVPEPMRAVPTNAAPTRTPRPAPIAAEPVPQPFPPSPERASADDLFDAPEDLARALRELRRRRGEP